MAHRAGWAVLVFVWTVANGVAAQAQASIPPEVAQATTDWAACRARFVEAGLKTSQTAEALADAALSACQPQQDKLSNLAVKAFGPSAADSLLKARKNARQESITAINEARSGKPFSDPRAAWGECVGEHAQKGVSSRDPAGVVADRAFDACKSQENTVLTALEGQSDHDQAAKALEANRKAMRDQVVSLVEAARSGAR